MSEGSRQYEKRFYRQWMQAADLTSFAVSIRESDLLILADHPLPDEARGALEEVRGLIERHIQSHPEFGSSLTPVDVGEDVPPCIRSMARAGARFGVGPMAAVAGVVAEHVGRSLLLHSDSVIVENGGDVFVSMKRPVTFRLYAGEDSPFSHRIAFRVDASSGLGVCTSSARVGPSLSLGRADAVVAIARDASMADAAATAYANRVCIPDDVDAVVRHVQEHGGIEGIIACVGERIGFYGDMELATVGSPPPGGSRTGRQTRTWRSR